MTRANPDAAPRRRAAAAMTACAAALRGALSAAVLLATAPLAAAQQAWAPGGCGGGDGGAAYQQRAGARCEGELPSTPVSQPLAFEMMGVSDARPVATCASDQLYVAVAKAQGRAVRIEGKSADRRSLYRVSFDAGGDSVVSWPTGEVLCKLPDLRAEDVWVRAVSLEGPRPRYLPLRVDQRPGDGPTRSLKAYVRATQTIRGLEYRQRQGDGSWSEWRRPPQRRYGVDSVMTLPLLPGAVTQELELRGELRDGQVGAERFEIGGGS